MRAMVLETMRQLFRPEFLNRVDEIVIFHSLGKEQLVEIVGIQLQRLEKLLAGRNMRLVVTPAARAWLAESGYDPVYGARPLKRAIQRDVQDPLAMKLLSGEFHEGDTVVVNVDNGRLAFHKNEPVKQAA